MKQKHNIRKWPKVEVQVWIFSVNKAQIMASSTFWYSLSLFYSFIPTFPSAPSSLAPLQMHALISFQLPAAWGFSINPVTHSLTHIYNILLYLYLKTKGLNFQSTIKYRYWVLIIAEQIN